MALNAMYSWPVNNNNASLTTYCTTIISDHKTEDYNISIKAWPPDLKKKYNFIPDKRRWGSFEASK